MWLHHSLLQNVQNIFVHLQTQKHVSNVPVWICAQRETFETFVTESEKSGVFLLSGIRSHVTCVLGGHGVWKCCGDANVTRCCPLSHVTSVMDAEWFWGGCGGWGHKEERRSEKRM